MDESKMTIYKMINDVAITTAVQNSTSYPHRANFSMSAHPVSGSKSVYIDINLSESYTGRKASIEIFNARGELVRKMSHEVAGINNHLSFDMKDGSGITLGRGMYIAKFSCESIKLSSQFTILR
jgi:hypothetical protein